jgi:phage terminase small subunit
MTATSKKKLTPKQAKFVKCYLANGFNGTQACIDAGYSEKIARTQGAENLAKPNIQQAMAEAQLKDSEKLNITRESLLADIQKAKDMALDEEQPQFQAYLKAIEMQAKMLGMNEPDQIDITGALTINTQVDFGSR